MMKDLDIWLGGYIRQSLRPRRIRFPVHVLFAFVDHFEPAQREDDPLDLQIERVERWIAGYESRYRDHRDRFGRHPQHTYFFPQEQYHPALLDRLAAHCRRGFGEVEVHIHHDADTPGAFVEKIERFKERLAGHGLLPTDRARGGKAYGFIHGNWALDNSRPDGRWCGLDNEITLLRDTGCYADFTMPSAPNPCQTRKINSIYFADDDPLRPKSHDTGRDLVFGGRDSGDLLMIQGPLALNWKDRTRRVFPRIENGDVCKGNPITPGRIGIWIDRRIGVRGRDDTVFVKIHTHGVKPRNLDFLIGPELERGISLLEGGMGDDERFVLHHVSAREMANAALAFNDGLDAPVEALLDYRYVLGG